MGWGGRHSWTRPAAARVRNPERASLGSTVLGACVLSGAPFLRQERGFSSCTEEGAMSRGCTVPAQGEGVPASPGDSISEGVYWAGFDYLLTDLSWLQLLG